MQSWCYGIEKYDVTLFLCYSVETVVLGGTHQENDFDRNVSNNDSKFIWDNCVRMVPSIGNAKIDIEWVGLRPGRSCVRLESTTIETSIFGSLVVKQNNIFKFLENGKTVAIIHSYGHGGSGVTLFWGCAFDVLTLVKKELK